MTITKTMTVDQASVEAEKLAERFQRLFDDFEAATGLQIDDITLRRPLTRQAGERERRRIKLYVALPTKEVL